MFQDRKKFALMADPLLQGQYPVRGLYQVLAIAAMCVQETPAMRPNISDVVSALNYLAAQSYEPRVRSVQSSGKSSSSFEAKAKIEDDKREISCNGQESQIEMGK